MPAFDHHFMPLYPPLEEGAHLQLQSQGLINYKTKSGDTLLVRFLCLDEQVRVIAVTIPRAAAGHRDQPKWMKQIMENAISALRLSGDPEAQPLFTGEGFINLMFQSDEPEPRYEVAIAFQRNPEYVLDIANVIGVFGAISNRHLSAVAALLAEGQVPSFPPHYRALSLIRAIELLYPDEAERGAALDRFQQHFASLNIGNQPFRNALPQLRTRCAHSRSRGRANPEPFVGIGYNETQLPSLVRLLQSVVAHGVQVTHGINFGGVQHIIADAGDSRHD
jgi:hypothetical protein